MRGTSWGAILAGAVVEEAGEPVGQGAAVAEPASEQHPSKPQRSQKKSRLIPAQSRQTGTSSGSRPGSTRSVRQPGQRSRTRMARS
ncbi:hypothetical protein [Streptomyces sp. NPDC007205]|uniref:hypothetical protein n=1 Tax=Streptomyces sp. NPDC007205 TaxID=3154316 RepID=UPI0033E55AD8